MDTKKRILLLVLIILFFPLSFLKLFSARITYVGDPVSMIIFSDHAIVKNHYNFDGEYLKANDGYWHFERDYLILSSYKVRKGFALIYDILLCSWWIDLTILAYSMFRHFKKNRILIN